MIKLLIKSIFLLFLFSCSQEKNNSIEEFVTGAKIAGVNGIHFGPDGMLYAASVIGSDISVINTETGEILRRYGIEEGVIGPDDVAFNSKGEFYWTSILTGEVAGFNQDGGKIIAGNIAEGTKERIFFALLYNTSFLSKKIIENLVKKVAIPQLIISDQFIIFPFYQLKLITLQQLKLIMQQQLCMIYKELYCNQMLQLYLILTLQKRY